ncbi:DUF6538 domain-containing protein [Yoonia sp. MH D7]
MSRPQKLTGGVYYLAKRVPLDVLQKVGFKVIKVSLRTKDSTEAKVRQAKKL